MLKDKTAPGKLETIRRFVNSLDVENPDDDRLSTVSAASTWLAEAELPADGLTEADVVALRAAREAIRADLLAHTGEGSPAQTWAELWPALGRQSLAIEYGAPGELNLTPGDGIPGRALATIAAAIYDAVRDGTWRRLKACRKHSCLFAFYDHSKNGSGAWCNMAVCGNRVKAERRRERLRPRVGSSPDPEAESARARSNS